MNDIDQLISDAQYIVIIQADNPDGDSLASALALEQILGDMGKTPFMYCGVNIPSYLTHLPGWDRVVNDLPNEFDLSIIVDTGALTLLEKLTKNNQLGWLRSKPCIVIDHHVTETDIDFATIFHNPPAVSTGEIIYELSVTYNWSLNDIARNMISTSILSDSLGLMSEGTSARSIHIVAELVESGVSLAELDFQRKLLMRKSPELIHYKGELLKRVEYHHDDRIATIIIPWKEIEKYSQAYNPSMLVIDDMRMTENTDIALAFKTYPDGKITAKIRCNIGSNIADKLAEYFGGGGHPYAAGFKVQDNRKLDEIKSETIKLAIQLLDSLNDNETI